MNGDDYRRLPNLLRKYRRVRGLTQRQVAGILGLDRSRVSKWENGTCLPTFANVLRLSIVYRVLVDALFIDHIRAFRPKIFEAEGRVLKHGGSPKVEKGAGKGT